MLGHRRSNRAATRQRLPFLAVALVVLGLGAGSCNTADEPPTVAVRSPAVDATPATGPTADPSPATRPGTDSSPPAQPTVITEDDDGRRIQFGRPVRGSLRLSNDWVWAEPSVEGGPVLLEKVAYAVNPGFTEWEIVADAGGESRIKTTGEPNCDTPARCPRRSFAVTVVVR